MKKYTLEELLEILDTYYDDNDKEPIEIKLIEVLIPIITKIMSLEKYLSSHTGKIE